MSPRQDVLMILREGLRAVDPYLCLKNSLSIEDDILKIQNFELNLDSFENVYVIGAGKATYNMARALEDSILPRITEGHIIIPRDSKSLKKITSTKGSHPIPDENSLRGAKRILELAQKASERDLIFFLLSGGASALLTLPPAEINLQDLQKLTDLLLKSGADISEINTVRKHISKVKGGNLAKACYKAHVLTLIISDVRGDLLSVIGSGPTVLDESTISEVFEILERYNLKERIPISISKYLETQPETPKEPKYFRRVSNFVISNNLAFLKASKRKAENLGYNTFLEEKPISGEARDVARKLVLKAKKLKKKPTILIAGGETTVTVKGEGIGGRNLELALASLSHIEKGMTLVSFATDGIDGLTDASGAFADFETLKKAKDMNLRIGEFLKRNDSYNFFFRTGDLIRTGETGTNVSDVVLVIVT
ncbi:MAG: glycerate kinase [Candidatus Methanofastidiosia archaeon]